MMNVLHIVPWLALRAGGTSVVVVGLAKALQALGANVTIYTTDMAVPAHAESLRRGVSLADMPHGAAELDITVFPVSHPYRFVYSPQLQRALSRNIREYDVVHIHSLFLHPQYAGWREAIRAKTPYVISPHGSLDPYIRKKSRIKKRVVNTLWQGRMLDGAQALHLTSEDERILVSDLQIAAPHHVIPIGIDTRAFSSLPPSDIFRDRFLEQSDGPVVLNHGRIAPKKGLDILIAALGKLREAHPRAVLVLVGPDDEGLASQLRLQAKSLGIESAVKFTGQLSGKELHAALSATDVWALPSHTENFGLAMVEAMAARRAVVTSPNVNISAAAESEEALVVVDNSPTDVAGAIVELLDAPARRLQLGENAEKFAARFDWLAVGDQFLELYDGISHLQRAD